MTILSIIIVDLWLAYSQCRQNAVNQRQYYEDLAEELITNDYDTTRCQTRGCGSGISPSVLVRSGTELELGRTGVGLHLTPTKKRRRKGGSDTTYLSQRRCLICKRHTTMLCSVCCDDKGDAARFCHPKSGRDCFQKHCLEVHSLN